MFLALCALSMLLGVSAQGQTQLEINEKACHKYDQADAEMNRVYREILNEYKGQPIFIEKLKKAQRAWLAFRDAHYESIYPAEDKAREYGTIHPMCRCNVLTELTAQRTAVLKKWIQGIPEGDACAGSIKTKD